MNIQRYRSFALVFALVFALFGGTSAALAQATESEPNDKCYGAQIFDSVALPFIVDGSLTLNDIDYYRIQLPSGIFVQVDLTGVTLGDPLLGFFDSNCNLLSYSDDYNSLNSRLLIRVPDDGVMILAATGYADFGFNGSHAQKGEYQLALTQIPIVGSISGQVVDTETGKPVPTWTWVDLLQCPNPDDTASCYTVSSTGTNDDRTFSFSTDGNGQPLSVGTYLVVAHADYYQDNQSGPFPVGEGENYVVVDIALTPNPSIGAISGRVVDAVSGVGLSGQEYPFAYVYLNQCWDWGCGWVSETAADGDGRFSFRNPGQYPPGDYEVVIVAQNYQQAQKGVPDVQEDEDRDIGNVPMQPNPIQFSEVRPCGSLPAEGGTCRYSVRVTNRSGKQLNGAAWSIVNSPDTGSLAGDTTFQTATPIKMTLKPGASRVVDFQFYVPSTVREGANICADALFGQDSKQPYFNTQGRRNLLCIGKGVTSFSVLSKSESQKLYRDQHQPPQKGLKPGKNRR